MEVAVDRADLRAQDPVQRDRRRIDQRDRDAELARRRGDLRPDPPGADDDQPVGRGQPGAQRVAVGQRAQRQDAVEVGARHGEPARGRAGGQQQRVERQLLAVAEGQPAAARSRLTIAGAGAQLDVVGLVEAGFVDEGLHARASPRR